MGDTNDTGTTGINPHTLNIYQRLIEVRKTVPYLQKDNKGFNFQYVSSSQTLGSLKAAMDVFGLLLVPRVLSKTVSDHTTKKGDHNYFTELNMEFTWVNVDKPEEIVVCPWYGQGLDDGEKGVGKALTYAEKYFMLKFFNIATDKDDPDSFQKEPDKAPPKAPPKQEPPKQTPPSTPPKQEPPKEPPKQEPPKQDPPPITPELEKELTGLKNEMSIMLLEMGGGEDGAYEELKKLRGTQTWRTPHDIKSEKNTRIMYAKVKAAYDAWKKDDIPT